VVDVVIISEEVTVSGVAVVVDSVVVEGEVVVNVVAVAVDCVGPAHSPITPSPPRNSG
jgi:hypothetical protein